jgi:FkbM family methyltransferase
MNYKRAASWRKPFVEPRRFFTNQLRKFGILRSPVGRVRKIDTFHLTGFTVVDREPVSNELIAYGAYEDELTQAFLRLVQPNQVVVDIGMHVGYFSVLFAQLVGGGGQVHSFEPTPSTRELARGNVGRFPQVTVHPYAVWSSRQTMTFNDYGIQLMGYNSFTRARLDAGIKGTPFQVQTTTLDDLRRSLDRPIALVKIDAESAEKEILIGAKELLHSDRPLLSVEVGDFGQETMSRDLVQWLEAANYAAWDSTLSGFQPHKLKEHYSYDNLIFAPVGLDITKL